MTKIFPGEKFPRQKFSPRKFSPIRYTYPFKTVGIDYAGSMFHKFTNDRNVEIKITCTSPGAVHLEVTTGVNANSLLLALRRFITKRVIPNMIISGNFKAFQAQSLTFFCKVNGIKWKFILERSPW